VLARAFFGTVSPACRRSWRARGLDAVENLKEVGFTLRSRPQAGLDRDPEAPSRVCSRRLYWREIAGDKRMRGERKLNGRAGSLGGGKGQESIGSAQLLNGNWTEYGRSVGARL
jgi:hypothetical protein